MLHGHVENHTQLSRQAQLAAYDGCAALRPVWDAIAAQYDAILTPSVVDEAPVGIERTGDAVRIPSFFTSRYTTRVCLCVILMLIWCETVVLLYLDDSPRPVSECARFCRRAWLADRLDARRCQVWRFACFVYWEGDR